MSPYLTSWAGDGLFNLQAEVLFRLNVVDTYRTLNKGFVRSN